MTTWVSGHSPAVEQVSVEAVRSLLAPPEPPCLSIYLPTHRNVPNNRVDRTTFDHLVESLDRGLAETMRRDAIEGLLHPFRLLAADAMFWRFTHEGLAVLASGGLAKVFRLQQPVAPLAMVGERFHLMPLLRAVTSLERFNVLTLTSRSACAWVGRVWHDPRGDHGDRLDPLPLVAGHGGEAVEELTRGEVISEAMVEPHRVKHGMGPAGRGATAYVHGGFGSKHDDVDRDTEIFLRHVDATVCEQVSRRSQLPLVLVATPRLAAAFRRICTNPFVVEDRVDADPHLLTAADLTAAVVPVFTRARDRRVVQAVQEFVLARDRGRGSGDLADVARAAVAGQVATLLVASDRFESGGFDRQSGQIAFDDSTVSGHAWSGRAPAITGEDLFGAVAEAVFANGGAVVTLAAHEMPTETGIAAIYRYAAT